MIGIKKTVETKLPEPYDDCTKDINPDTSRLVKIVLEKNITYRKVNCYDICLADYASALNISFSDVSNSNEFSYLNECSELCPVECTSNTFDVIQNEHNLPDELISYDLRVRFFFIYPKFTKITQTVKNIRI